VTHTCGLMYPPRHVVLCVVSHGVDVPSSEGRSCGGRGAVGSAAQANVAAMAAKRAMRMAGRDTRRSGLVERNTY